MIDAPVNHDQLQARFVTYKRMLSKPPIVFPEIAASYGRGECRFDVLTMAMSAGHRAILHGHEVKWRRADFDSDIDSEKWRKYLDTGVHYFSFVTPVGLVKASEIPEGMGLIVWNPEKGVFRQIVKAARIHHELPPANLLTRLVLRAEEQRVAATQVVPRTRVDRMAEYLKMEDYSWMINGRIRDQIREARNIHDVVAHERQRVERDRAEFEAKKAATEIAPEGMIVLAELINHAGRVLNPRHGSAVSAPAEMLERRQALIDKMKKILEGQWT